MKRCAGLMLAVILAALPCAAQQDSKAKNQNENKAPAKTEPNPVVARLREATARIMLSGRKTC